jgi:hypothetical protein
MNIQDKEQMIDRRLTDMVKTWAAVLGPFIGVAFGAGIYKSSLQGKLDQIPRLEARIISDEARISDLEKNQDEGKAQVEVVTTRFTEQIAAINNRMGRMEDLLEKTFYTVNEIPKDRKR